MNLSVSYALNLLHSNYHYQLKREEVMLWSRTKRWQTLLRLKKSSLAFIIIPIFLVLVLMIALGFGFSLFDKDAYFAAVIFVVVVLVICWTVEDKYCKGRGEEFEDEDSGGEGGCGGGGCRGD